MLIIDVGDEDEPSLDYDDVEPAAVVAMPGAGGRGARDAVRSGPPLEQVKQKLDSAP